MNLSEKLVCSSDVNHMADILTMEGWDAASETRKILNNLEDKEKYLGLFSKNTPLELLEYYKSLAERVREMSYIDALELLFEVGLIVPGSLHYK